MRLLLAAVLVAACRGGSAPAGRLDARFTHPPNDTTRIMAAARAATCAGNRGVLLEGISGGSGVLAWIRGGDGTAEGSYTPLPRGDSLTRRGAVVTARLGPREPSRGVLLDSGAVVVTSTHGLIGAHVEGRGMDLSTAARVGVEITFDSIPPPTDTVECRVAL